MIYMDNNATSLIDPQVLAAMNDIAKMPLNASSLHAYGRKARALVEQARDGVAKLVNAKKHRVIFTSSGTESNNMALAGLDNYKILVSGIEHASVLKMGRQEFSIPVTANGIIAIAALEGLLQQHAGEKILVSVMLANNETGIVQPIKEIAQLVHQYGGVMHTDAVQCVGKIAVDITDLGVDMLTISAHKFGGPQGAAALIVANNVPLRPILVGGGQEYGYRAGTENIAAICGFGAAAKYAVENVSKMYKVAALRDKIEGEIKAFAPNCVIFGQDVLRLPNTSLIAMPGVASDTQLMHFDMAEIALSSGSACSSGKVETSHVLLAMGVNPALAQCALRISLGIDNTEQEAGQLILKWQELYSRASERPKN